MASKARNSNRKQKNNESLSLNRKAKQLSLNFQQENFKIELAKQKEDVKTPVKKDEFRES